MSKAITVIIGGDDSGLQKSLKTASEKTSSFGSGLKKTIGGIAAAIGGVGIADFAKKSVDLAVENQKAQASLAVALRNTTHASSEQISSIQEWIVKTAEATGVSKEQLIPAFRTLATSTKDAGKAQGLLKIAMDVAAGTGKPLAAVALAIGKAYNGTTTSLKKLDPALQVTAGGQKAVAAATGKVQLAFGQLAAKNQKLQDAQFNLSVVQQKVHSGQLKGLAATTALRSALEKLDTATQNVKEGHQKLTDAQIGLTASQKAGTSVMDQLNKAFGGQAQKAADTTAGKMARLKIQFQEVQEKVGNALLPVLSKLSDFMLHDGKAVVALVGALAGFVVIEKIATGFSKLSTAMKAMSGVASRLPEVFTVLKGAMLATFDVLAANPIILVIAGIVALGVALVLAYKHFKGFRDAVKAVFGFLKTAAGDVIGFFQNNWKTLLFIAITGPIGAAILVFKKFGPNVIKALGHIGGTIWGGIKSAMGYLKNQFLAAVTAYVSFYVKLPGRIIRALAHIGGTVWGGIVSAMGYLKDQFLNAVTAYVAFYIALPGRIIRALAHIGGTIWGGIKKSLGGLVTSFARIAGSVVSFFASIPGRIVSGLGNLSSTLFSAGKDLMAGFAHGIAAGAKSIISHIPGGSAVGKGILAALDPLGGLANFDTGGLVRGPMGGAQLAIVHGGERVFTPEQFRVLTARITSATSSQSAHNAHERHIAAVNFNPSLIRNRSDVELLSPDRRKLFTKFIAGVSHANGGRDVNVTIHIAGSVTTERDLVKTVKEAIVSAQRRGATGFARTA